MPNYGFMCEKCDHKWECFLSISKRDQPLIEPCPSCKEKSVAKDWGQNNVALGADMTLTPDKATGGRWGELMNKMKSGLPDRYKKKLDTPNNMSGKRWY